jgi:hypothetical protein
MSKTTYCPFTHSLCAECALYRGRHRYLSSTKPYQGYQEVTIYEAPRFMLLAGG